MDKHYDPKSFEKPLYERWMDKKYFRASVNKEKKPFTIMMPPPNITGQLHIGHALDMTIQDALIRYKRMNGFEALWQPGVDHASIATEVRISDELKKEGLTKEGIGREEFLKRAYDWKDKYGGRIVEQAKMLGCSCDWDRMAFTMDERCSKAVKEVFVRLYDKGLIYLGDRIINWCPKCTTALSDAEVEHEEADSSLWHIEYPAADGNGSITVATTRPETMLGDTAVAVNPKDKRYAKFIGRTLMLPLMNREIPVVADSYVDSAFGTGAVKITPAHDPNDFEVGQRHELPLIRIMDDNAVMNENAGKYQGLDRYEARKQIVADLTGLGLLVKTEKHKNNVGHCYRCDSVVEPIVSKQWFVKMKPLAEPAIAVVKNGETTFVPKRFEKLYLHWMENIRDWCISRQLWWGHRIPVYTCTSCKKMIASLDTPDVCPDCGNTHFTQEEAVLDTWFSSALWPFSTLGWPDKNEDLDYFYPTDVLVTAYDIIYFWVARMIFSGIENMGETPFKYVLMHGIVRDELGRKMSKSLGNGLDPLELIDKYSADSLRFSLVNGISQGGDIKYSAAKLDGYHSFMNKLWNASRFVLMNAEGAEVKDISEVKLNLADKWIIHRFNELNQSVVKYMDKFEVGLAAAKMYDFVWNQFCDWYIELAKADMSAGGKQKEASVAVLVYVLRSTLKLMHPIIPFITAKIYDELPVKDAEDIMISDYPAPIKVAGLKKAAEQAEDVMEIIRAVRALKAEMNAVKKRTAIYIRPLSEDSNIKKAEHYIAKIAGGTEVLFVIDKPEFKAAVTMTAKAEIFLPADQMIDESQEIEKLTAELKNVNSEIARAEGKLNNKGFTDKAPPALIAEEKAKLEKYTALKAEITARLSKS